MVPLRMLRTSRLLCCSRAFGARPARAPAAPQILRMLRTFRLMRLVRLPRLVTSLENYLEG
jgi:hypothetical protein